MFAQRFAADGTPQGLEFKVNEFEEGDQFYPSVAMMPDGGFVIGFHTTDEEERDYEVMARRFDSNGEGTPEFQMNVYTDSLQKLVRVAGTGGGFVAVWESYQQDGDVEGVFARSYDQLIGLDAQERQVPVSGVSWQTAPAIAGNADGRYVIAWYENTPFGDYRVLTRVYSAEQSAH